MKTEEENSKFPQKMRDLKQAAEPLLKYLNENYHPHVTVIVTPTSIHLMEGLIAIPKIFDYVKT